MEVVKSDVDNESRIGSLIEELRGEKGLSIAKLAVRVGMNVHYLGEIERGRRLPTDLEIRRIADFLDYDENVLFDMVGRIPLSIREELESQILLQQALKEVIKNEKEKKQEIYLEFLKLVHRITVESV